MHRESKAELTDRLRREGRFEEFKQRREDLKAEGIRAKYAWYQAAVEFPPEHLTLAAESLIPWSKAESCRGESRCFEPLTPVIEGPSGTENEIAVAWPSSSPGDRSAGRRS